MERIDAQRILGVTAAASTEEIYQAYQKQRSIHLHMADATYSLLSPEQSREELSQLDNAYRTLSKAPPTRPNLTRESTAPSRPVSSRTLPSLGIEKFQELLSGKDTLTGQDLLQARQASGVEMSTLCQFTKIGDNYIHAIESMNTKDLPERVYLRGFLSNYLSAFGVRNQKPLIDSYIQAVSALGNC